MGTRFGLPLAAAELFPGTGGLALFDLLGPAEKTLHANPGGHTGLPRPEITETIRFLGRYLGGGKVDDREPIP